MWQRLGSDVREGKRRQFNYIGTDNYFGGILEEIRSFYFPRRGAWFIRK